MNDLNELFYYSLSAVSRNICGVRGADMFNVLHRASHWGLDAMDSIADRLRRERPDLETHIDRAVKAIKPH